METGQNLKGGRDEPGRDLSVPQMLFLNLGLRGLVLPSRDREVLGGREAHQASGRVSGWEGAGDHR